MSTVRYLVGDVSDRLAEIPDGSIDLVVTSPPFLALRSYLPADHPDKGKEIGSEATPAAFLDTLLELTAEWGRVLAPHGSLCVELGDTYSGSSQTGGDFIDGSGQFSNPARLAKASQANGARRAGPGWPLAKSLCGIPHAYELSLIYGWNVLRRDAPDSPAGRWRARNYISWARPNPPVGALGDKFRPATSYITVACRGTKRYFDLDAVRVEHVTADAISRPRAVGRKDRAIGKDGPNTGGNPAGAPPLDWHSDLPDGDWLWKLATQPYAGSHYATFPLALPLRLIEAMCPQRVCRECGKPSERIVKTEYVTANGSAVPVDDPWRTGRGGDVLGLSGGKTPSSAQVTTLGWTDCGHDAWRRGHVLDPFGGSGTTGEAAAALGRDATLIDLDERNLDLARQRIGFFLETEGVG